MPTPARTSTAQIVAAGRSLASAEGLDALTMQRVAALVGVRAPSLYKRVPSRAALVRLVASDLLAELGAALADSGGSGDPEADLTRLAHAFRAFALAEPGILSLVFSPLPAEMAPDPQDVARSVEPLLVLTGAMVGPQRALPAARTLTAWISGFARMEGQGAFGLGGSVDEAFDFGLDVLLAGLRGAGSAH
ncbi:TetR family transcriptional regulator [Propionicimonas paludicola]|uniref:TetR family transcriptional regulator n=1 Tax=Propionicimonas paludicola TaxID=185243 RepID=A0A2A9CTY7_9ACTN|nr:TetR-like C-terminal domain-containing protein [Propionicimonas paludicola]PFG17535.1 TetR family transcriptional regulator [Propionicimonas paludicola]